MTYLKIWQKWIKILSNTNSKKMKGMAENKRSFTIKTIQIRSFQEKKHTFAFKTIPPLYVGLQEQLYEPWVLIQEAFWWHLFIFVGASLHSSMSER